MNTNFEEGGHPPCTPEKYDKLLAIFSKNEYLCSGENVIVFIVPPLAVGIADRFFMSLT